MNPTPGYSASFTPLERELIIKFAGLIIGSIADPELNGRFMAQATRYEPLLKMGINELIDFVRARGLQASQLTALDDEHFASIAREFLKANETFTRVVAVIFVDSYYQDDGGLE
ncbi:MAG: hypothetical protein ACR2PZ_02615 [Pseudomonadales bacterium]